MRPLRRAVRVTPQGATLADWQIQIGGVLEKTPRSGRSV